MGYELRYKGQTIGGGGSGGGSGDASAPAGVIWLWSGKTAPEGWALCDGTAYQIADYPALADFFEQQFGSKNFYGGDGTTTFAVPDLRGHFPLGVSDTHEQGSTGGSEEVTLTVDQMPEHRHTISLSTSSGSYSTLVRGGTSIGNNADLIFPAGSSKPHPNMPPFLSLNYIIKTT